MRFVPLFASSLIAAAAWAGDAPELDETMCLHGKVLETYDVDVYTYARVATGGGETWVAVDRTPLAVGAEIALDQAAVMHDFWSRTQQRTFEWIVFGRIAASCSPAGMPEAAVAAHRAAGVGSAADAAAAHRAAGVTVGDTATPAQAVVRRAIPVEKAAGVDGRTVAEVVTQAAALDDKPVAVRGRVARYTSDVLGKNWLHLRDGSGSAAEGSDDVLVTTTEQARVGDIVLVRGTVRTNRDFGAGYAYKIVIEDATLER